MKPVEKFQSQKIHIVSILKIYFSLNMILNWISIVIFFFKHYYLEIANSMHIIQMDLDIQFDVLNHNHNISSKMPHHKPHSIVNQKWVSKNGIGTRYKLQKTKSRSLTG